MTPTDTRPKTAAPPVLRWMLVATLLACAAVATAIFASWTSAITSPGSTARTSSVIGLSAEPDPEAPPSRVDYARLEQRIERLMQEPDMVGLAVGTVEDGRVRYLKGFGETLAGSGDPVTTDTVFRWASVSKGVAASLIVTLDEQGELALETPIAAMRTTLRLPDKTQKVTLADVLSHRVGLVKNAWDDRLERDEDPKLLRSEMGELPPFCPPAGCFAYQNIAYDAVSEVVEDATGQRYADAARQRLFEPLGMTSASVDRAGLQTARSWARPHRRQRQATVVNDVYYRVPAAGGVNSSIEDLLKWMRAQMGDAPRILSPTAIGTLHRPLVPTPSPGRRSAMDRALADAAYGLGWRSFTYAGRRLVGHRGAVDGYRALLLFDPADKSGIVMLWNSNWPNPARLQLEFFDMLYGLPPTDWLELGPPPALGERPAAPAPAD